MRLDRPNLRMSTSNVDIQILLFIYYTALTGKTLDERTNVAGTVQFYSVIQLLQKLLLQVDHETVGIVFFWYSLQDLLRFDFYLLNRAKMASPH